MIQTAPDELSIYYSQHYRHESAHLRGGILRLDAMVSVNADYEGGDFVTKPFRYKGNTLVCCRTTRWHFIPWVTGMPGPMALRRPDRSRATATPTRRCECGKHVRWSLHRFPHENNQFTHAFIDRPLDG